MSYNPSIGTPNRRAVSAYSGQASRDLPQTYEQAREAFERADKRRGGARGIIAHNTRIVRREETGGELRGTLTYGIVLHETEIVTFYADSSVGLDSGGYQTVTTRDRWNRCGVRVGMSGGVPSVTHGPIGASPAERNYDSEQGPSFWSNPEHAYRDGMRLHADGSVSGPSVCGTVDEIRSRRRRSLAKHNRDGYSKGEARVLFFWPSRQGGYSPFKGTVPEAFLTDSGAGLAARTRAGKVA